MVIRVTRGRYDPATEAHLLRVFEDQVLPGLRQRPGFRSYQVGLNREAGTVAAISTWDTREQADTPPLPPPQLATLGVVFEAVETYAVAVTT